LKRYTIVKLGSTHIYSSLENVKFTQVYNYKIEKCTLFILENTKNLVKKKHNSKVEKYTPVKTILTFNLGKYTTARSVSKHE
jgi:hypothetical protein